MIPSAWRPRKMPRSSASVSGRVMMLMEYPASSTPRAAAMIRLCAGGLNSCGTCIAIRAVRPERICRQALCGANPISSITRRTRSRVSSATSGLLLRIRDTVATETPLAAAMSTIVVDGIFDRVATAERSSLRDGPRRRRLRGTGSWDRPIGRRSAGQRIGASAVWSAVLRFATDSGLAPWMNGESPGTRAPAAFRGTRPLRSPIVRRRAPSSHVISIEAKAPDSYPYPSSSSS